MRIGVFGDLGGGARLQPFEHFPRGIKIALVQSRFGGLLVRRFGVSEARLKLCDPRFRFFQRPVRVGKTTIDTNGLVVDRFWPIVW